MNSTLLKRTIKNHNSVLDRKHSISLVKSGGERTQVVSMEIAGSSIRSFTPQTITPFHFSFILGHCEKPKELLDGFILSRKIIEQVAGKKIKLIGLHRI